MDGKTNQANNSSGADALAATSVAASTSGNVKGEATPPKAVPTASTGGQSGPPAVTGQQTTTPIFRVTAPKTITGKRAGLDFKDGVATTNNAITAHAALEIGCQVFDTRIDKPAFDSDADGVGAILAERAKANW